MQEPESPTPTGRTGLPHRRHRWRRAATASAAALLAVGAAAGVQQTLQSSQGAETSHTSQAAMASLAASKAKAVPTPDHVVVVIFENRAAWQVYGMPTAPYLNKLAAGGAKLTNFYGETHPSQPNYFAMFSGSTQGVTDDSCITPRSKRSANLAAELIAAHRTWRSYNEGLPSQGSTVCKDKAGKYAQKHNPWFAFKNVPTATGYTMAQFPKDFRKLPTVSFVVPNLCNDMHDCTVRKGDTWLKDKLGTYAAWAKTHNSLLIVTFDEDNFLSGNKIATVFYGANVKPGVYSTRYNHYNMLRTIEDMYGTTHAGNAASAKPITEIWARRGAK